MSKTYFRDYLDYLDGQVLIKVYKGQEIEDKTFEAMPSYEGFLLFLINEKGMSYADASPIAGENRGMINIYAIDYLKRKITAGARNSSVFISMLNTITNETQQENQSKVVIQIQNDSNNSILKLEKEKSASDA